MRYLIQENLCQLLKKINCVLTSRRELLRIRSQVLSLQMSADSGNPVFDKLLSTSQCHIEAQNIFKAAVC